MEAYLKEQGITFMDLKVVNKRFPSFDVSRETFDRLNLYASLLIEENKKFNLIGSGEVSHIWERHIFDSMQLFSYLDPKDKICDMGSGAGFPGIVLGILGCNNITMVESIRKKASFLENVSRETSISNKVICGRIESLEGYFPFITGRAVAPLKKLLMLSRNISNRQTRFVFPKGRRYMEELEEAKKNFSFEVDKRKSVTSPDGTILLLRSVSEKRGKSYG